MFASFNDLNARDDWSEVRINISSSIPIRQALQKESGTQSRDSDVRKLYLWIECKGLLVRGSDFFFTSYHTSGFTKRIRA